MSVKELVLKGNSEDLQIKMVGDRILVRVNEHATIIDRNQAHLLYLYLKERFEPKVCGCYGPAHAKGCKYYAERFEP